MFLNKKKILKELLDKFVTLLSADDYNDCIEFLNNNEFLLCFNTIVTQLYEYDKRISLEEYQYFTSTANKLNIYEDEYEILKKIIK
jgi:hypothetical protein